VDLDLNFEVTRFAAYRQPFDQCQLYLDPRMVPELLPADSWVGAVRQPTPVTFESIHVTPCWATQHQVKATMTTATSMLDDAGMRPRLGGARTQVPQGNVPCKTTGGV